MRDQLVQVTKRTGDVDRVPRDQTPVVELYLAPGQTIVSFELKPHVLFHSERKTVDWSWTAYIATPLAGEHCFTCGHRLVPRDPSPYCQTCWDARHGELT